ncbi:hypothetical protein HGM15179_015108 [Zosterops borbonicus]|uniref:Uncharacterized protein n=1 Tax=Zosterops borbonicus TaxID=364589 RepID=A0A8K1G5J5_9PASS|nr:hypothetical protein HGM15179_015108 [Zosterops borbonicus]
MPTFRVGTMAVDWIGFAYASLLVVGGVVGYTRKGSKVSLAAGLTFGSVAGYGAYCVTCDPRNVKISLFQGEIPMPDEFIAASIFSFIFSFDHYNGNEIQEVQEINASWTTGVPEAIMYHDMTFVECLYPLGGIPRVLPWKDGP